MKPEILIGLFLLLGIGEIVGGVFLLAGLAWGLIALGVGTLTFAFLMARGAANG